ncbi:MAG: MFS transporter [Nitrososphaerales archaeon]
MSEIRRPPLPAFRRLIGPLDHSLLRLADGHLGPSETERLRWLWLDGLFATISLSFYSSFMGLFAAAYGASNVQVGQLTAIASLCGMVALLPGARAIEWFGGGRKALVLLFGGGLGRAALLIWALLPFFSPDPGGAFALILIANAMIGIANNFANPAWTAMVADIVPREIRGRFFAHRSVAVNMPTLLVVPFAGWLIHAGSRPAAPLAGYQLVFGLAFLTGMVATVAFSRLRRQPVAVMAGRRVGLQEPDSKQKGCVRQ